MKRLLLKILIISLLALWAVKGHSQTLSGQRLVVSQSMQLRSQRIDSISNDGTFTTNGSPFVLVTQQALKQYVNQVKTTWIFNKGAGVRLFRGSNDTLYAYTIQFTGASTNYLPDSTLVVNLLATLNAGLIAYGSPGNAVTWSNNFAFNDANNTMSIGTASASNNATLNLGGAAGVGFITAGGRLEVSADTIEYKGTPHAVHRFWTNGVIRFTIDDAGDWYGPSINRRAVNGTDSVLYIGTDQRIFRGPPTGGGGGGGSGLGPYTTATDANFVANYSNGSYRLIPITANRTFTPPGSSIAGDLMIIWTENNNGFNWSPVGTKFKDAGGNTITQFINGSYYIFQSNGTNFIKTN